MINPKKRISDIYAVYLILILDVQKYLLDQLVKLLDLFIAL